MNAAARIHSLLNRRRPHARTAAVAWLLAGAAALVLTVAVLPAAPQGVAHYPTPDQPPGTPRLEFDIVSVKPSPPDERGGIVRPMPGFQGYTCDNMDLLTDMTIAYGVPGRQIKGGPGWIGSDRWDIETRSDQPHDIDELHLMLAHALEDRFQMKLHREMRQETVLALKLDSGGIKLKQHEPADDTNRPPIGVSISKDLKIEMSGTNVEVPYIAYMLTRMQPVPVLDQTGLTGHYDFDVTAQLAPPQPPPGSPPGGDNGGRGAGPLDLTPLFDAMRSQLGIRVEKGGKGPVEYLVIDAVRKPTPN